MPRIAALTFAATCAAACTEGTPAVDVDASIDAPTGPLLEPVTLTMSAMPGQRRALPWDVPVFTVELDAPTPGVDLTPAGVLVTDPAVQVTRVHAHVATAAGVVPLTLVIGAGGAVFRGTTGGDVLDPAQWDDASGGPVTDQPWIFLAGTPTDAVIPPDYLHGHDLWIDDGATVRADSMIVAQGAFVGRGRVRTIDPLVTRSSIECRVATVRGDVPMLVVGTTCAITGDLTTERIDLRGGTLDIAGGAVVDTGIGESFVRDGGILNLASGTLRNGRAFTVWDGGRLTASAGTRIEAVRFDVDSGGQVQVAGELTAGVVVEVKSQSSLLVVEGGTFTSPLTHVDGELDHRGSATFGRLEVGGAGRVRIGEAAVASATECVVAAGGMISGPDPCP